MKVVEKILLILFLISSFVLEVKTQDRQIFFENLREQEGLPYHIVNGLDQDSLGRLWLPTYNGLYQYDGYRFKAYQHSTKNSNSISSNLCRAVLVDHKQNVWIATEKDGLCLLNPTRDSITRFTLLTLGFTKSLRIDHLAEDKHHNIWLATSQGITSVKFEVDTLTTFDIPNIPKTLSKGNISSIYPDRKGNVWIGTSKGLYAFDSNNKKWLAQNNSKNLLNEKISDIIEDDTGQLWLGVRNSNGIYTIPNGSHQPLPYPFVNDFANTDRVHLSFDQQNHLWIAAGRSGVYRHNLLTKENDYFEGKDYEQSTGNFSNFTHSPLLDHFGNVWFCGGGLHKWSNTFKTFSHYTHPFGNYQSTAAIYDDTRFRISSLWGKGIVIWNKASDQYFEIRKDDGLFSDRIYAIVPFTANTYLLGGEHGYQLVDLQQMKFGKHIKLKGTIYHGINDNGKIVIGGSRGLWQIEKGEIQSILPSVNLRYFQKTANDKIWITTLDQGLVKWDRFSDSLTFYTHQSNQLQGLQSNRVEHLDIAKDGTIWLATGAGVESFHPEKNKWQHYSEDEDIAGIRANAIHMVGDSAIWLSNNQGISRLDIDDKKWTHFKSGDGLLNTYYYERSSFVNKEGRLFFGGRQGIVHFTPADLKLNPYPPKLYFDEIKVDNKQIKPIIPNRGILDLDWNHRFFEVNFTGLHLTDPAASTYKYRLLPQQEEWITIQKQPLFFSGTRPGTYQLEILAINGDGILSPKPLVLAINVKAPFWSKTWFIALIACLLLLIMIRYFLGIKSKYQNKIDIERKMNEMERAALRSQMNPHFIFNAMSSIQHFILEKDEENALKYLSTLSRLIRKVLDYSNKNFIPFDEELALLKDYIQLEQLRFGQQLNFILEIADNLNPESFAIPPLLLQPLVENAVNHGLRPLKKADKTLNLKFEKVSDNTLAVCIKDNGVGRIKAQLNKNEDHQSSGTQNVIDRLQLIGDQMDVVTNFEIIDLIDEEGIASGTLVKLLIPFQLN